jgi:LmbE family N-acetylglucosaminyl deacetylase
MHLHQDKAEIYLPGNKRTIDTALRQTTHLGIGAHQDDLEIFAIHGILQAYSDPELSFSGITVTDGRGAPRSGPYRDMSDDDLWKIRCEEQKRAAEIGQYAIQVLMNYPSHAVKSPNPEQVIEDLQILIQAARPDVIYTHNLADKHDTHAAVAVVVIKALRSLPDLKPVPRLLGCEVWRSLDWLPDEEKVVLDVSNHQQLQMQLLSVYASQIAGGKRYDLAAVGRRLANATFLQSHMTDRSEAAVYAMDLTPLVTHPNASISHFLSKHIRAFEEDVRDRLVRLE